jgi:hypothetical protein
MAVVSTSRLGTMDHYVYSGRVQVGRSPPGFLHGAVPSSPFQTTAEGVLPRKAGDDTQACKCEESVDSGQQRPIHPSSQDRYFVRESRSIMKYLPVTRHVHKIVSVAQQQQSTTLPLGDPESAGLAQFPLFITARDDRPKTLQRFASRNLTCSHPSSLVREVGHFLPSHRACPTCKLWGTLLYEGNLSIETV